jgi:thioredoxin:protein disulfide reductase
LFLPSFIWAQQNKLIVSAPAAPVELSRGSKISIPVKVSTLPGFHVNSDKPRGEFLIPFSLSWQQSGLKSQRITYPAAETIKVGNDDLSVFTGTFNVTTEFVASSDAPAGPATLTGKVHYQACNNQMCFRPATAEVSVPVVIR